MKTTFYTVEIAGPALPYDRRKTDAQGSTHQTRHLAGVRKLETLERFCKARGVVLLGAYWMTYSKRYGYSGAARHIIKGRA